MPGADLGRIWVYLAASPLLWLTVTLVAYLVAHALYRRTGDNPLLNPVAVAVALLITVLVATGTPYATFFEGAQFVHFLLGPATVALAVPLFRQLGRLRRLWLPVAVAVTVGVGVAALSAIGIARVLGSSAETQLSLAPKSVTAPVAMGIAEKVGGLPSLTAVLVVATGILGAIVGTRLLGWCGVRDDAIRGMAMGVTSHGIGTARAFQVSPKMGAFSGLGMALSAFATALLVPWLVRILGLAA
jgi:predicted murein hydrolase (TIGR00659 family)